MRACRGRPVSGRGTLRQVLRRGRKAGGPPPLLTRAVRQPPDERAPPGAQPWIPTTKCVGMTAGRGMASPRRRPRHAAPAARGQRSGAKRRACGGLLEGRGKGGREAAAQWGRPRKGLDWSRSGGQEGPGYGEKRAQEGRRAAHGGLASRRQRGGNYSSPTRRFRAIRRRHRHFLRPGLGDDSPRGVN